MFPHLNPKKLAEFDEAYKIRREIEDENNYILGGYVRSAIESTVGNMFRKKGAKPIQYMEEPILRANNPKVIEDKAQKQRELLVASFKQMQLNWELSKKQDKNDSVS